jgi:hypothetical protein
MAHVAQQSALPYAGADVQIGESHGAAEREAEQAERTSETAMVQMNQRSAALLHGKWDWKRSLKGLGIGVLAGGVAALGAATLFSAPSWVVWGLVGAGALSGWLVGGATGKAAAVSSCSADKMRIIVASIQRGLSMIQVVISALGAFGASAAGNDRAARAREALSRYFKSNSAQVAAYVLQRFVEIRGLLTNLRAKLNGSTQDGDNQQTWSPKVDCHSVEQDDGCQGTTEAYAAELKPGQTQREGMVFCPKFFESEMGEIEEHRALVMIHELAHVLAPGKNKEIHDVAYKDKRYFLDLTTSEALTNADSYAVFVEHVIRSIDPMVGHDSVDLLDDCEKPHRELINQTLHLAQRWIDYARRLFLPDLKGTLPQEEYFRNLLTRYMGGTSKAILDRAGEVYEKVGGSLGFMVQIRCHPKNDEVCTAGKATTTGETSLTKAFGPGLQLCPDWLNDQDADHRTILLLAEMMTLAGVTGDKEKLNYAEFAREVFTNGMKPPALEEILAPTTGSKKTR